MHRTNPFPGMDPWMELRWGDVHTKLMTYASDQLQPQLPAALRAVVEEYVALGDEGPDGGDPDDEGGSAPIPARRGIRPDVRVERSGGGPFGADEGGVATLAPPEPGTGVKPTARPLVFPLRIPNRRWIEVREDSPAGRLVTVIEILSPANKRRGPRRAAYLSKQQRLARSGVNLVEVDLIRGGRRVARVPDIELPAGRRTAYRIDVYRAANRRQVEVYPAPLRDRLPAVGVPLRPTDADAVLDLQPLIDAAHANGRWTAADHARPLDPPLLPDDAHWAAGLLDPLPTATAP